MVETAFIKKSPLSMMSKLNCCHIKSILHLSILISLCMLGPIQGEERKSALSRKELRQLAVKTAAVEKGLSNIKIESEAWEEHSKNASGPWQRTPIYWSSTAWFSGDWSSRKWNARQHSFQRSIKGKARVDVHKEVLEAQESIFPYGESSYCLGFDGQYGRVVYNAIGRPGKTLPKKTGRLIPHAPASLGTGPCTAFTGTSFSLQFFEGEIYKFSKMFELASDPNSEAATELKFTRERFEGIDCIKISSKFDNLMYWLDPSHGFALRGEKSIAIFQDDHIELVEFKKVSRLREVLPGIWWPMEASIISRPYAPGKPWRRFVYRASNVVANDPNLDESIFTVPFPDGYLIDDKVRGVKYRVGQ
jgi:hypothetical protein